MLRERCPDIAPPFIHPNNISVYAQYTIQVENRQQIIKSLTIEKIPISIHYPISLHLQPAFTYIKSQELKLQFTQSIADRVISLPMAPNLSAAAQDRIVSVLQMAVST